MAALQKKQDAFEKQSSKLSACRSFAPECISKAQRNVPERLHLLGLERKDEESRHDKAKIDIDILWRVVRLRRLARRVNAPR